MRVLGYPSTHAHSTIGRAVRVLETLLPSIDAERMHLSFSNYIYSEVNINIVIDGRYSVEVGVDCHRLDNFHRENEAGQNATHSLKVRAQMAAVYCFIGLFHRNLCVLWYFLCHRAIQLSSPSYFSYVYMSQCGALSS